MTKPAPLIDWGVAQVALSGETVCGDRHLVESFPNGTLVAVVDGLGHGPAAAEAAETALAELRSHCEEPVDALLKRCHHALLGTRGAALSLASFSGGAATVSWLGIGNVEGVIIRADKAIVPPRLLIRLFPGVAGHRIPPFHAVETPVYPGDILMLVTDGVRPECLSAPIFRQGPQRVADGICAKYRKGTDDALVLVARYKGGLL